MDWHLPACVGVPDCYDDPRRRAGLPTEEWNYWGELMVVSLATSPDPGEVNGNFPV